MATVESKPSRKRKAKQADIDQYENSNNIKRAKLSSDTENIKKNTDSFEIEMDGNNNSCSSNDPFASFASSNVGFSSFLSKEKSKSVSPTKNKFNESSSTEIKFTMNKKTEKDEGKKEKHDKEEEEKENSNTDNNPFGAWSNNDNNKSGFGSFDTFESFGSFGSFNNDKNDNNQFHFDKNASNFSFDDITSNSNNNNNNNDNDKDKKNENNKNNKNNKNFDKEKEKPIAELTGIVDAGDTEDITIYEIKCKVWEFDKSDNKWREKGIGFVKLNKYNLKSSSSSSTEKIKVRILCRKDVTLKRLINARIKKDTKFAKDDNTVKFTVFEQVENKEKNDVLFVTKTYCLRSKESDKTKIDTFLSKIQEMQQSM